MPHHVKEAHAIPRKDYFRVVDVAAEMYGSMLCGSPLLLQKQAEVLSAEGCGAVVPWALKAGAVPVAPVHTKTDCLETASVCPIAEP